MKQPKLTPDQWQQFNMLQTIITTFSPNPDALRSVTANGNGCKYNSPISKPLSAGCAIGIFLDSELAEKLDEFSCSAIEHIMIEHKSLLPEWLQEMNTSFLRDCQSLHDDSTCWAKEGLSEHGNRVVENICNNYKLPYDLIQW